MEGLILNSNSSRFTCEKSFYRFHRLDETTRTSLCPIATSNKSNYSFHFFPRHKEPKISLNYHLPLRVNSTILLVWFPQTLLLELKQCQKFLRIAELEKENIIQASKYPLGPRNTYFQITYQIAKVFFVECNYELYKSRSTSQHLIQISMKISYTF